MELKIEHLAPYLPYSVPTHTGILTCSIIDRNEKNRTLGKIKMYLRPLSDLTKEIEHNGEKFVPIIELLKIEMDLHFKNCSNFDLGYNGMSSWIKYNFDLDEYGFFYDTNFISFKGEIYNNGDILRYYPVLNQYHLIQKIHSWHFDTHRLIQSGLAIDINTLNK